MILLQLFVSLIVMSAKHEFLYSIGLNTESLNELDLAYIQVKSNNI